MNAEDGSASLLSVLLLPLLVLVLAGVIDLGLLRLGAARARAAADLAATTAVNDQDDAVLSSGFLRLAGDAEDVARQYLALNLVAVSSLLAVDVESIASNADIAAFPGGGVDPRDGTRYERPTVRIRAAVPLRTGALRSVLGPTVVVHANAVAAAR